MKKIFLILITFLALIIVYEVSVAILVDSKLNLTKEERGNLNYKELIEDIKSLEKKHKLVNAKYVNSEDDDSISSEDDDSNSIYIEVSKTYEGDGYKVRSILAGYVFYYENNEIYSYHPYLLPLTTPRETYLLFINYLVGIFLIIVVLFSIVKTFVKKQEIDESVKKYNNLRDIGITIIGGSCIISSVFFIKNNLWYIFLIEVMIGIVMIIYARKLKSNDQGHIK